jgi:PIN domain nuclease of toxin-antitoxin system
VCEAYSKLVSLGTDPEQAWETVTAPIPEIVAFEADQAKTVGQLIAVTRSKGLSLGDRACLGLGMALKAPVYTTDRAWKSLNVGVKIHVIR